MHIIQINPNNRDIEKAKKMLEKYKVAIFVVVYNAECHIENVLNRIPQEIREQIAEIYIIDDSSTDQTFDVAKNISKKLNYNNLKVLKTPFNRGYGGNQKLGYLYAIKRNFDIVILLHGDGQYPPEYLPQIINAFENEKTDAIFASRMINKMEALKGGMPFYKWIGNQILTALENFTINAHLSEFHTGYRAYKIEALKKIPFQYNSDDFHFDTEIIIQLVATKQNIKEIAVPTFYGNEICRVNGIKYALNCIKSVIKYRLSQFGLFYEHNFDFESPEKSSYFLKLAPNTLHQYILKQQWNPLWQIADIGSGEGKISALLAEKVKKVISIDQKMPQNAGKADAKKIDINNDNDFEKILNNEKFDCVLTLDTIEHLIDPEKSTDKIFNILKPHGILFASTANIGYFVTRFALLLGVFNYGKRGILDMSHKRLFTIYSFKKLLSSRGFIIKKIIYFGPPIIDMVGNNPILKIIDFFSAQAAKIWPSMFAYNFLIVAERMESIEEIYLKTFVNEKTDGNK